MTQEQSVEVIPVDALLEKVRAFRDGGYRLVQVGATRLPERVEVTYSFELNGRLTSLRLELSPAEPQVPSISGIFGCVVLYENEIHDLFNVHVDNMALDFQGHLYETAVRFPFGTVKAPPAKSPPAAPARPAVIPPALTRP
jgi:ech hydrogenase subunit D